MKKLNVAIIGYGRSGCDIHGAFMRSPNNDICNVKYVVEADPARAAVAREHFGCETLTDYKELFAHKDELDFVTNASYSDLHYPINKDLMEPTGGDPLPIYRHPGVPSHRTSIHRRYP